MLNGILGGLGLAAFGGQGQWGARQVARIAGYIRYKRLYDGFSIRLNQSSQTEYKVLKWNLARPIINISSGFLAAKPIHFTVTDDEDNTALCDEIWTESGSSATFLENALLAGILGDACILVTKDSPDKVTCLKWMDPSICFPEFNAHNYEQMVKLTIQYDVILASGGKMKYKEIWADGKVTTYNDEKQVDSYTYDEEAYEGVPAVWIRNQKIKGDIFGRSDLQPIAELLEMYDHACNKQAGVIDYYASPNLYAKGVTKTSLGMTKTDKTMYFLPSDGDIGFIEWKGTPPGVEEQIARLREAISEISETPQVAFSKTEGVGTQITGVGLKLLYGPLISKTERKQFNYGPSLERVMWMALISEGVKVERDKIGVEWPDPTPQNVVEEWQIATEKVGLGVSKEQVLREENYTQDEIDQFKDENAADSDVQAQHEKKMFNAGSIPNTPYRGK